MFIVIRVWFKMTSASSSSSSAVVKRKALSIDNKLIIIKLYDEKNGVFNKQQIADQLGLPSSSLRTILKNRKEIEKTLFQAVRKVKRLEMVIMSSWKIFCWSGFDKLAHQLASRA